MAALIIRRRVETSEMNLIDEDIVDTRPAYLRVFPSASSILKDLKFGVLLGRYYDGRYLFCLKIFSFAPVYSFVFERQENFPQMNHMVKVIHDKTARLKYENLSCIRRHQNLSDPDTL